MTDNLFKTGYRCILLIHRKKDGGTNHPDRKGHSRISKSPEEFDLFLSEFKSIQNEYPHLRIYSSVNERDFDKAVKLMKFEMLHADYMHENDREHFYLSLNRKFFSFLSQERCQKTSNFLFDLDSGEDYSNEDELEQIVTSISGHTEILQNRVTPNGHHLVTKPFNYTVTKYTPKKNALILWS